MLVDDIRISALNYERDTGGKPVLVLLTSDEYTEINREVEAMRVSLDVAIAYPVEIHGLIVVIKNTLFHQTLVDAGMELLRPNADIRNVLNCKSITTGE